MWISASTAVKKLQSILNKLGNASLVVDGKYGPLTDTAYNSVMDTSDTVAVDSINEPRSNHFSLSEYYSNKIVDGVKKYKVEMPPRALWPYIQQSMDMLEQLRTALGGAKIFILSGYRTPEYNAWLYDRSPGGVSKNSPHMRGTATDISVDGMSPHEVFAIANKLYKTGGVGLYDGFVHVDLDYANRRPARW
jgi:uncharacterized protein YcbK (DUF882 family)